ncbi:MAG: protein translocase subunit SecF [Desulfobacterales bacterium]
MQFIKPDININFTGKIKVAALISLVLLVISIGSLVVKKGPKYGVDFAGGTLIQVSFENQANIADIKSGLNTIGLQKTSIQRFGEKSENEYLIRTNQPITTSEDFTSDLEKALNKSTSGKATTQRVEMVGPQVGKDLREKALFAMFFSLLFITIYISGRFELKWILSGVMAAAIIFAIYVLSLFNVSIPFLIAAALIVTIILFWFLELKYAMGAIVAIVHDVLITVGVFSIFDKEFTLPIIAALLTIIGYSLNDTIIVFDRIRENLKKHHKSPLNTNINRSINETLSRTILTSGTTLVVVTTLFIFGGGIIHDFAFALIVGILIGTYSSIYVASPILLAWQKK